MRKLLLLTFLGFLGINAFAQDYTPAFTHTSGTQVYNTITNNIPISVTITPVGNPGSTTPYCGTGPYFVAYDASHTGGYHYSFSPAATHVKFEIADFQADDTLYMRVNGTLTPITPGMLSSYLPGCTTPAPTSSYIALGGKLTSTLGAGNNGVTLTYASAPGTISSIELIHDRLNTSSGGVVWSAYAALDSCLQPFVVTADSPFCTKHNLNLHVPNFPNTTFSWTTTASIPMPIAQTTVPDPIVPNLQLPGSNGTYTCVATRGVCTYTSSKDISVDLTPNKPTVKQYGPKCAGEADTVYLLTSPNVANIIFDNFGNAHPCTISPFNFYAIPSIQIVNAGIYKAVSLSLLGCPSDTGSAYISLNSLVVANFSFDLMPGCKEDSVQFHDLSLGNTQWHWDFGDSKTDTTTNPLHIYSQQGSYRVRLIVNNARCVDSITKPFSINHPLEAKFAISDDSICQGDTIYFTNQSTVTPGVATPFDWDFKDGYTSNQFEPKHGYTYYGDYNVRLIVTDYLGCHDTAYKIIAVDSLGSASFFSDTVICAGETIKFEGDYSTIGGTYALWDFGDGHTIQDQFSIQHAFDKPGIYDVQLNAHYRVCHDTTYHQNIYVNAYPTVDLGPDTAICPGGQPISIGDLINSPISNPNYHWRWNTETKDTTANIMVHHPGTYSVTVDNNGCTAADSIVVKKNCYIDIPNVFTPNNDGYNDYFLPRQFLSRNVSKFDMTIYNRWGQKVFETNTLEGRGWDGKFNGTDQPEGVYIYVIKVSFGNDTNESYDGNITLLR
ncbi:MAG: PKD domain-containing protein [Bacteroidetes bacterium]|nr:PKD domain-containing protein [Bacteroidota bacterium]